MNQRKLVQSFYNIFEEIFTIFGFRAIKHSTVFNFFITITNLVFQLTMLTQFLIEGNLFISTDPLSKFTDIIELFGPIFTFTANLIIFFNNRKICLELEALKLKINEEFESLDKNLYWKVRTERIFFFLMKFMFITAVGLGIELFQIITLVHSDPGWHLAIKTRLYSLNMNRLMYIYFIFHCDYISARIQILNDLRIKIIKQNEGNEQEVQKNLKKIKSFDLDIAKIIQLSREYLKWMLLLNLTGDVIYIIVDSYWIYGGFIFGNNPNFAQSCSCLWGKIVSIIVLFYSCNEIQIQRDNSLAEIFEWKSEFESVSHSKRRFFLQHIHCSKFLFDANGFFFINYGVLIGMAEAITIYMVYFFQFMSETNIFMQTVGKIMEAEKLLAIKNQSLIPAEIN